MTSIKPPGPPSTPPLDAAQSSGAADAPGALEGPDAPDALAAAGRGAAEPAPTDPIATLASDVQAGRITMHDAVERLLERAVAQAGGQLTEQERAGLGVLLREALEADPVLSSLR